MGFHLDGASKTKTVEGGCPNTATYIFEFLGLYTKGELLKNGFRRKGNLEEIQIGAEVGHWVPQRGLESGDPTGWWDFAWGAYQ